MSSPEMKAAQAEIDAVNKELTDAEMAYNAAVANENDNPLYGSATLQGKLDKLSRKHDMDKTALNSKLVTAQNKQSMLKADAQTKLNIATQQYNIDNQNYKDNLTKFQTLINMGALSNMSGEEIGQVAVATGLSTGMIQSIIQKQKQDAVKPQVITNTDDNGNVTISVIDTNTGDLIANRSLGKVGKADGSGGQSATAKKQKLNQDVVGFFTGAGKQWPSGKVDPVYYSQAKEYWVSQGGDSSDFDKQFAPLYAEPSIYDQYGISKELVKPDAFKKEADTL